MNEFFVRHAIHNRNRSSVSLFSLIFIPGFYRFNDLFYSSSEERAPPGVMLSSFFRLPRSFPSLGRISQFVHSMRYNRGVNMRGCMAIVNNLFKETFALEALYSSFSVQFKNF